MGKIKANKQTLIRWKIYIDRAKMYIGYIQFFMIGMVFLDIFKGTGLGDLIFGRLYITLPVLFLLFILFSLIIGRIDTKLGLREEELRNLSASNPVLREIHANLLEVKDEMKEIKSKL